MTDIPVLVIAFNKPDLLFSSLQKLKINGPRMIYIHLDGPGNSPRASDLNLNCKLVIEAFAKEFKDVKIRIQDKNLGGKFGVLAAITWFFESEDFGIILEEDIDFADQIFEYTEFAKTFFTDEDLFALAFFNPIVGSEANFYLNHWLPWGWATSSAQWNALISSSNGLQDKVIYRRKKGPASRFAVRYFLNSIISKVEKGQVHTWDAQVHAALINSGKKVLFPRFALTKHLGISADATHADSIDWWPHISIGLFERKDPYLLTDLDNIKFESVWRMSIMSLASDAFHSVKRLILNPIPALKVYQKKLNDRRLT
jgi:hypothetical protein